MVIEFQYALSITVNKKNRRHPCHNSQYHNCDSGELDMASQFRPGYNIYAQDAVQVVLRVAVEQQAAPLHQGWDCDRHNKQHRETVTLPTTISSP